MIYEPHWARYEKGLSSDNEEVADKAGAGFEEERKQELLQSQQAREWEKGRKSEWQQNKREYVKKREQIKRDPSLKTLEVLRNMGNYETGIIPSPGFVLIDVDPVETRTSAGYELPTSSSDTPNTGTVVEFGDPIKLANGQEFAFPHEVGDRVIFGKFIANLHVSIQGKRYYFMQFEQILARFKNEKDN